MTNIHNKITGQGLTVSDKSYTDVIDEIINKNNGIVIYPHCNSSNGLFQERGRTDRTHLADHFNYQPFNILQTKNASNIDALNLFISQKRASLMSGYCITLASDARSLRDIFSSDDQGNFTWIKADPTFEGLKQIIYESDLRIKIQAALPEDKPGYQVIDRVEIINPNVFNDVLPFNANLNSIIGGRSTGKSVLLTAIANKLTNSSPVSFDPSKSDYQEFVKLVSDTLKVIWKDGAEDDGREIEFFHQGYMYDLAKNDQPRDKLIQDILKQQGKDQLLSIFSAEKSDIKKSASSLLNDYFSIGSKILEKEVEMRDKGDKKGIEDEIIRLKQELSKINTSTITDEEKNNYEENKKNIEVLNNKKLVFQKDLDKIEYLKSISLIKSDMEYELSTMSAEVNPLIEKLFEDLKSEFDSKWISGLSGFSERVAAMMVESDHKISDSLKNKDYIKVVGAYKESVQLSELEQKIGIQNKKLLEIVSIIEELKGLVAQKNSLLEKIYDANFSYYEKIIELAPKLVDVKDNLKIHAKVVFEVEKFGNILKSAINLQSQSNKQISEYVPKNNEEYIAHIRNIFPMIVSGNLSLKSGYNHQTLAFAIMTECFYSLNYELEYEGDNFKQMSDGKKAFVILKLLLDFSGKNCPILIDQPEDDLDNRAIYHDLVQYLKRKKSYRQIIVVTHNPNIAVGADSELIIVANQNGVKNENEGWKKFQYLTGSLEHTQSIDASKKSILFTQGIREHVCAILEGGDAAFKLREHKYAIKS